MEVYSSVRYMYRICDSTQGWARLDVLGVVKYLGRSARAVKVASHSTAATISNRAANNGTRRAGRYYGYNLDGVIGLQTTTSSLLPSSAGATASAPTAAGGSNNKVSWAELLVYKITALPVALLRLPPHIRGDGSRLC